MAGRSANRKNLRTRMMVRMLVAMAVFTIAFACICLLAKTGFDDDLGNYIADSTSEWRYTSNEAIFDTDIATPHMQILRTSDGRIAMRDLTIYHLLKDLELPVAITLYVLGIIVIAWRTVRTFGNYFDEVVEVLTSPQLLEGESITLSPELADVSQQIELLQARADNHERAALAAEQRKNELVAYLAHDIRTPLTAVVGYLSLLYESPDLPIEKRTQFAGIALEKAERLEGLINEFFEITRYNLGTIPLERETVDMTLFIQQVLDEFGFSATQRNITFDLQVAEGLTAFLDPSQMARALGNVVRNAVAYADEESIVLVSAVVEEEHLVICVRNHGKEISPLHLERIFERFYREDETRSNTTSGQGNAGLGLAIAREITRAHGGDITATSESGTTEFVFRI